MSKYKKVAKCPQCLPDHVGAIFRREYVGEGDVVWQWKCSNCGHRMPFARKKPTNTITASQQRVIDRLTAMGWRVTKTEMSGRRVWVEAECDNPWFWGNKTYGTIGPTGKFNLHSTGFGTSHECKDWIAVKVYLEVKKPVAEAV